VIAGRGRERESERNRRDKVGSQPKRDSSPPPVKRVRRDTCVYRRENVTFLLLTDMKDSRWKTANCLFLHFKKNTFKVDCYNSVSTAEITTADCYDGQYKLWTNILTKLLKPL